MTRAWRFCKTCGLSCGWNGEAWVCRGCGAIWIPEPGRRRYAPPGEVRRVDNVGEVHAYAHAPRRHDDSARCGYCGPSRKTRRKVTCAYCQVG